MKYIKWLFVIPVISVLSWNVTCYAKEFSSSNIAEKVDKAAEESMPSDSTIQVDGMSVRADTPNFYFGTDTTQKEWCEYTYYFKGSRGFNDSITVYRFRSAKKENSDYAGEVINNIIGDEIQGAQPNRAQPNRGQNLILTENDQNGFRIVFKSQERASSVLWAGFFVPHHTGFPFLVVYTHETNRGISSSVEDVMERLKTLVLPELSKFPKCK